MKKIFFSFLIISVITVFAAAFYFKISVLPVRFQALIVDEIEKVTGKKLFIRSLCLSLVKGIVFESPVLYDDKSVIMRAKDVRCRLLLSAFKKKLVIPVILVDSPSILVRRRQDNSINLSDLLRGEALSKSEIEPIIRTIVLKDCRINFVDDAVSPPIKKNVEKAYVEIRLLWPSKIAFSLKGEIPSDIPMAIRSEGEYRIPQAESSMDITLSNVLLKDFADYYKNTGFAFSAGLADAKLKVEIKEGVLRGEIDAALKDLRALKDDITSQLAGSLKSDFKYDMKDRRFDYSGRLDISAMQITGINELGKLENIRGGFEFNNSRISSDDIRADIFNMPWKAKVNLINFDNPILDIYADSSLELSELQKILLDNFGIRFPARINGKSDVRFFIQLERDKPLKLNGYVRMHDAVINPASKDLMLEHMTGEVKFTQSALTWSDIDFTYHGRDYRSDGVLTNFSSPGIRLAVKSRDLDFKSMLAVNDKLISITELTGKYLNSRFSVSGKAEISEEGAIRCDINGTTETDLRDISKISGDSDVVKKMKPRGVATVDFSLNGNIRDIKRCAISALVKSRGSSIYGFELKDVNMDYNQASGEGRIRSMWSSFYGGSLSATGKIEWLTPELAYLLTLNAKGIKLEKLKNDTGMRNEDVSGNIKLYASINGRLKDSSAANGLGKISIANGRLWQLDLFRGLGSLIFTSDFNAIVFAEGSCDFKIGNKAFSTNNLVLKSDLINLYGSGKIGFDKTVTASLKSELTEEAMYPGFRRNIASAIGKYSYIEVSGAVNDPKYKMRPSVTDFVEDIATRFLQE